MITFIRVTETKKEDFGCVPAVSYYEMVSAELLDQIEHHKSLEGVAKKIRCDDAPVHRSGWAEECAKLLGAYSIKDWRYCDEMIEEL